MEKNDKITGLQEGREEGEWISLIQMVYKKLKKGKVVSEIAAELEESEERIGRIVTTIEQHTPEYNVEAICKELRKK